jgi:pimeloyl-ACP methyl ester carboxylesterase
MKRSIELVFVGFLSLATSACLTMTVACTSGTLGGATTVGAGGAGGGALATSDGAGGAASGTGDTGTGSAGIGGAATTSGGTGSTSDGVGGAGGGAGSSVPSNPIPYMKNQPFTVDSGTENYVYVPTAYDDTHQTPITLLIWLHGCGGMSSGDIWTVSPGGSQSWISLAVGGQEGNCWDVDNDPARVLAALADIKTHFNIAPRAVVLGGYSSGGDLTYRTAFYNADLFAGVLVENSSPYRDTGSTQSASLAAASWKLNTVHLAHLQDST